MKKVTVQKVDVLLMSSSSLPITGEAEIFSKLKNLLNNKKPLVASLLCYVFNPWKLIATNSCSIGSILLCMKNLLHPDLNTGYLCSA